MTKQFTVQDFFNRFPNDSACLDHLFKVRFGDDYGCERCGEVGKFRKLSKLPAYTCNCGHHVHPMAGTPFERSTTPLQKWFYAMYLFTVSRHGVPAKELQRQLGVTYKCAWRIGHQICQYLGEVDGDDGLSGHVEIDETFVGGKGRHTERNKKTIVFGMLQRGGQLMTKVVPDRTKASLLPIIHENIAQGSGITSDELSSYQKLNKEGYAHTMVKYGRKQYVQGIHHVNGLESFWGQLKRSIRGTHIHVSEKHMPKYLAEFKFHHNMRKMPEVMFSRLLLSF